jgi:hypothetical protein
MRTIFPRKNDGSSAGKGGAKEFSEAAVAPFFVIKRADRPKLVQTVLPLPKIRLGLRCRRICMVMGN